MTFGLTIVIIVVTCIISFIGFSNRNAINKLIFSPTAVKYNKEWYRFITHGFIHADMGHLFFNMLSLYFFGPFLEMFFDIRCGSLGWLVYLFFYLSALVVSSVPTYLKNTENQYYLSLGASGAISAVVFATIVLRPTVGIYFMFIPIPIPAFIYGVLYVIISAYLDKKGTGNINHSAHLFGALYGIAFIIIVGLLTNYPILSSFVEQIQSYLSPSKAASPF